MITWLHEITDVKLVYNQESTYLSTENTDH